MQKTAAAVIIATANGGKTWSLLTVPRGIGFLDGLSCPNSTDCWAVGGDVIISTAGPTIESFSPTSGKPGTVVTLNGINLSGATAVSFSGTAAKMTSDTATRLVTAVPKGAKTGVITITTPLGRVTSPTTFTVTAPLVITTSSLPSGTVGHSYDASVAATGGVGPYTWRRLSGVKPPGLTFSTAGVWSGTATTAGTYSFTVQVTDSKGTKTTKGLKIIIAS
jgi:hypothetical protein